LRGHEDGNGGSLTGPNPVGRGKSLPLAVAVSGANVHDSTSPPITSPAARTGTGPAHRPALRTPTPHRPVRAKGLPLPRLPRPGRSPDLLQETREDHHPL